MEMGSSCFASSGATASTDSLNGLKFGKKIYFEDVGVGVSAKTGALSGSSSSSSPATVMETATPRPRKGRGVVQGAQPPRCQVEGCKVDLTGAKAYYCRHKVCATHSKSPKVIVNGLEQRFCQQCSRFHQLPEFDQGKRSCRRRLAGHNERRRKPPLRSSTSCYGRLSSSFHEDISRVGGFSLEFTYPRSAGREVWPSVRIGLGEQMSSNQSPPLGRYPPHLWKGSVDVPSANVFAHELQHHLQGSAGGTVFPNLDVPSSECFVGISNSNCALSLLSSQPWGLRNRSSGTMGNNFMNNEGVPMAQTSHSTVANDFMSNMWSFKSQDGGGNSHGIPRELGLGHVPEPASSPFTDELVSAGQESKRYMDRGQHRSYGSSSNQMHWSL